jgi:hypothetical protein
MPQWIRAFVMIASVSGCCVPLPDNDPPPPAVDVAPPPLPESAHSLDAVAFDIVERGVPQAPAPAALFAAARPHTNGPVVRGLFVCSATLDSEDAYDDSIAGGPDVALEVRLGRGEVRSTPQTALRIYTLPVARLDPGDPIWIRVLDRDVIFDDTISERGGSFASTPFVLDMDHADVDCRVLEGEAVARPARAAIGAMASAIDALDSAAPDPKVEQLGYPQVGAARVMTASSRALAWLHPSDPEYVAQRMRAHAFETRWSEHAAAAVEGARRALPTPGTNVALGHRFHVRVTSHSCGTPGATRSDPLAPDPSTCHALLELEARERTSVPMSLESAVLTTEGTEYRAAISARQVSGTWVAPAEVHTLEPSQRALLAVQYPDRDPPILRVRDAGEPILLRLR